MYKILTPFMLAILTIALSTRAEAQQTQLDPDAPYTIGVGLMYGTEIEQPGIRVDGYYTINQDFRVGVGLGYFYPDDYVVGDRSWFG
mgnify:CR=1 FL=1